jgi:hypothetical protein
MNFLLIGFVGGCSVSSAAWYVVSKKWKNDSIRWEDTAKKVQELNEEMIVYIREMERGSEQ